MQFKFTVLVLVLSLTRISAQEFITAGDFLLHGQTYSYRVLTSEMKYMIIIHGANTDTFYLYNFEAESQEVFALRLAASLAVAESIKVAKDDSTQLVKIIQRIDTLATSDRYLLPAELLFLRTLIDNIIQSGSELMKRDFDMLTASLKDSLSENSRDSIFLSELDKALEAELEKNISLRKTQFESKSNELFFLIRDQVNQQPSTSFDIANIRLRDSTSIRVSGNLHRFFYKNGLDYLFPDSWKNNGLFDECTMTFENYSGTKRKLCIESAQVTFENGVIKDVSVSAYLNDNDGIRHSLVFKNMIPFPISSRNNVTRLKSHEHARLFLSNGYGDQFNEYYVYWNDVLDYDFIPYIYTDDLSPKDWRVSLTKQAPSAMLAKDETQDIVSAAVYTDLFGLSENQPNGLLQAEFKKKILLRTDVYYRYTKHRKIWYEGLRRWPNKFKPIFKSVISEPFYEFKYMTQDDKLDSMIVPKLAYDKYFSDDADITYMRHFSFSEQKQDSILNEFQDMKSTKHKYYQFLNYIEPIVQINRFERDNKEVNPNDNQLTLNDMKYISPMDVLRYKNISIGTDYNAWRTINPITKWTWDWGVGIYLYNTAVAYFDTASFQFNTAALHPRLKISFNPETRYEATLSVGVLALWEQSGNLAFVEEQPVGMADVNTRNTSWIADVGLLGTWRPNLANPNRGKLFFRANFLSLIRNLDENHLTIQVGYSFNFLSYKSVVQQQSEN